MALQGVPWAIGGGAKHPPEVARLLAFMASGGGEGVITPGALTVRARAVPGAGVRVMPGAAALLNRSLGGGEQAYLVRNPEQTDVPIPPTGSSGGRTDLVALVVDDPQYDEAVWPADIQNGPYVHFRVYTNVSPSVTKLSQVDADQTGLALALVTLTVSDATIEQADIKSLIEVAQPRFRQHSRLLNLPNNASETLTSAGYTRFPDQATWQIDVPDWAVKMHLELYAGGVKLVDTTTGDGGNWWGNVRATLGTVSTDGVEVNEESQTGAGATNTFTYMAVQELAVPKAMRGTRQTLKAEALRSGSSGGLEVRAGWGTTVALKVSFFEEADATFWEA